MTSRQTAKMDRILAANAHLGYRDMRDLLMEHGADGATAAQLCEGRL